MFAFSVKEGIGIGDGVQFTSLPENFFRAKAVKLVDNSKPWFFDFNPYVDRSRTIDRSLTRELWNFGPQEYVWPRPRTGATKAQVYLSNAEIWAALFRVPVVLNRPRLYRFEDWPFERRRMILLHVDGRSHGAMPQDVIAHVVRKYGPSNDLVQVGVDQNTRVSGIPFMVTPTLWDLAELISRSRMFIGMDSGPGWIAACYPDVVLKRVRNRPEPAAFREWVPLEIDNYHSHWDDRCAQIFNCTEQDIGFTSSFRKI